MEDGGDGPLRVELRLKNFAEENGVEDVSFIEGDPFFVGSNILAFREVVVNRFKDPVQVFKTGVDVVIHDGDVMVGLQQDFDSDMWANISDPPRHKNILCHV